MGLSVGIGLAGMFLAFKWYGQANATREVPSLEAETFFAKTGSIGTAVANKWNVDEGIEALVLAPFRRLGNLLWRGVDALLIDGIVNASAFLVELTGDLLRFFTTGNVRNYALGVSLGVLVLAVYVFAR